MEALTNAMILALFQMRRMEGRIWDRHQHRFVLHAQNLLIEAASNAFHHVLTETQLPLTQLRLWYAKLLHHRIVHTSRVMVLYTYAWLPVIPRTNSI